METSGAPVDHLNAVFDGRYVIEQELGRGGMATVYRAADLRHGRSVAIKVLRPEVSATATPERFLREIAIAAKLSHPHILPVFESGRVGDIFFYVMPCATGESLRQRLRRERQLDVGAAIGIARQVAGALAYAHRQGVIHRDIKPENILFQEGEALVTDFGIALAIEGRGCERLTETGLVIGTPVYMSPEQARGDALDERSDLYSLACVLYEMLAGEPPFIGPTAEAIVVKRASDPAPSVRRLRDAVPPGVDRALQRALARVPADRFATVAAFVDALAQPDVIPASRRSVAVLPFVNMSAEADNEYFSDGITEDIIAQLAKIRSLKVISRTSVMRFKQRTSTLPEIARNLGVSTILEGSVRRAGDRIRIVAELIDAETDEHLWAERYDRELTDLFAIQAEVAEQIAVALQAELSPRERAQLGSPRTPDIEAHNLHLLGRFYTNRWSTADWQKGVTCLAQAIARDARYAGPHATLAVNYALRAYLNALPPTQTFARAEEEARIALALDDADAEGHVALALVAYWLHWEWDLACRELERALELSPGHALAHTIYGALLDTLGRHEESMRVRRQGQQLNPLDSVATFNVGYGHLIGREFPEAVGWFERALELAPQSTAAIYGLGMTQVDAGDPAAGVLTFERGLEQGETDTAMLGLLGWAYGLAGRRDKAAEMLDRLLRTSEGGYVSSYHVALVCLGLGRHDEMFAWLERAWAERSTWMVWFHVTPGLDPVRDDPRFQDLVRRMRLPQIAKQP